MAKNTKELTNFVAKNDTSEDLLTVNKGEIVLYQLDNSITLEVRIEEETVWLTQAQMGDLFQKDRTTITRHINNVFSEGELEKEGNVHFLHFPFSDKPVMIYNLDVIISVGYRVKSQRGTDFRKWANKVLKEYLLRGFAINRRFALDLQRHNAQYQAIDVYEFQNVHDRFLCIDDTVYHFGASLKDLGKKWFAFSRMEISTDVLLAKM